MQILRYDVGRGLHSFTFDLNLSRVLTHKTTLHTLHTLHTP